MELEWSEAPNDVEKITLNDFYKLEDENNKLREALEEIVECDPSFTNPTDIAQQALDEGDTNE